MNTVPISLKFFASRAVAITSALLLATPLLSSTADAAATSLPLPVVDVNTILPANAKVQAALPTGPQHVSIAISHPGSLFLDYAGEGYVDFTGGIQAGCTSDVTITKTNETTTPPSLGARTRIVVTSDGSSWERGLAGATYVPKGVWTRQEAPGLLIPVSLPTTFAFLGSKQLGSGGASGFCLFTELARYTSYTSPKSTTLLLNTKDLATLNKIGDDYFSTLLVNALHPPSLPKALSARASLTALDQTSIPLLTSDATWTLSRHQAVTVFTSIFGSTSNSQKVTVTFTPSAPRAVPVLKGPSLVEQAIQSRGGYTVLRHQLGFTAPTTTTSTVVPTTSYKHDPPTTPVPTLQEARVSALSMADTIYFDTIAADTTNSGTVMVPYNTSVPPGASVSRSGTSPQYVELYKFTNARVVKVSIGDGTDNAPLPSIIP